MTDTQTRDHGLDILKGIGCALMVIAHSKLKMWNYEDAIFWGNLALDVDRPASIDFCGIIRDSQTILCKLFRTSSRRCFRSLLSIIG
ncbi:MAG: hypothetical protein L6Q49_01145 [Anaerolineales bacterium]|nr:hypothetical protein [Anaerolineales bacterium]